MNRIGEDFDECVERALAWTEDGDSVHARLQRLSVENRKLYQHAKFSISANEETAELVAELERTKTELQDKALYLQTLFETVPVGILVVDAETRLILDLNPHAQKLIGLNKDQVVGIRCNAVVCPAGDHACPILDLGQTVDQSERVVLTADARRLPVLKSVVSVIRDGHKVLVESFVDITDIKQAEIQIRNTNIELAKARDCLISAKEEAERTSLLDPLTSLPNRRLVYDRLRQTLAASLRSKRKNALLFIDLDNFKVLNDTRGHKTGDLMLQEVASRLTACVRMTDTVARLGGDEFVVILGDLSESAVDSASLASIVAEKILAAIGKNYQLNGHECNSTSSIGITIFGEDSDNIDDILQQADIAMYHAKTDGRNTVRFFSPALQLAITARSIMERELREAIEANQFVLYYQPQIEHGVLMGAEALVRWNHPRSGFLAPGNFIPLAEETGLILPLGDWVLKTACTQIAAWAKREETAHLKIAVNISARQFRQPDFVPWVLSVLKQTGAQAENLKLELTESMLVDNFEDVIRKMTELRSHGLRFSMDDFGTGYSSLSYLKRLPLSQLKIDRAFVQDILQDASGGAIAQTIISLGKALGMSVMAEGIETEEQRQYLASLGCHAYQGFLIGRPMPVVAFERLLELPAGKPLSPPAC